MSDDLFSTLEEHNNSYRSPPLKPARPNFGSTDTPPPLVEVPDSDHSDSEADGEGDRVRVHKGSKGRPKPSQCDSILIRQLGPDYPPEIAFRAGHELLCSLPNSPGEDRKPEAAHDESQMIGVHLSLDVPTTSEQNRHLAEKAVQASKTFHAAIGHAYHVPPPVKGNEGGSESLVKREAKREVKEELWRDGNESTNNIHHHLPETKGRLVASSATASVLPPQKPLDVKPPPRPSLPTIHTSPPLKAGWGYDPDDSIATSPALAKFAITPIDCHPSHTLAKLQNQSPPGPSSCSSAETKQTLPSLVTALSSATDSNGTPYPEHPSAMTRPSPSQISQFGPSPSTYSQPSPVSTMSPPRLPTHPSYWRTTSQNSTISTPSDYASATVSATASTPASSILGQSPADSMHASGIIGQDTDDLTDGDMSAVTPSSATQMADGLDLNGFPNQSYKCTWPGCNAVPFQTQYLLNSHANVHSNTRPHFCPVKACPRGPGGQGFKRKNEMIRHGLVHQSPGYVCPFCPDQQHKYPRPDNLQRHVRVHHVDKDRDDPLLRDVLAQRPEGGNRGRRRRLGS